MPKILFIYACLHWVPYLQSFCFKSFLYIGCQDLLVKVQQSTDQYSFDDDKDRTQEDLGFRDEAREPHFRAGQSKRVWGELYKVRVVSVHYVWLHGYIVPIIAGDRLIWRGNASAWCSWSPRHTLKTHRKVHAQREETQTSDFRTQQGRSGTYVGHGMYVNLQPTWLHGIYDVDYYAQFSHGHNFVCIFTINWLMGTYRLHINLPVLDHLWIYASISLC